MFVVNNRWYSWLVVAATGSLTLIFCIFIDTILYHSLYEHIKSLCGNWLTV